MRDCRHKQKTDRKQTHFNSSSSSLHSAVTSDCCAFHNNKYKSDTYSIDQYKYPNNSCVKGFFFICVVLYAIYSAYSKARSKESIHFSRSFVLTKTTDHFDDMITILIPWEVYICLHGCMCVCRRHAASKTVSPTLLLIRPTADPDKFKFQGGEFLKYYLNYMIQRKECQRDHWASFRLSLAQGDKRNVRKSRKASPLLLSGHCSSMISAIGSVCRTCLI